MGIPYSGGPNVYTEFLSYGRDVLIDNWADALVDAGWAKVAYPAYGIWRPTGNPSNGNTVTIDSLVYTFRTSINNATEREVLIGADKAETMLHLSQCINDSGVGKGTEYSSATTAHPTCTAGVPTATTLTVSVVAGGGASNLVALDNSGTGNWDWAIARCGGWMMTSAKTPQGLRMKFLINWDSGGSVSWVSFQAMDTAESTPLQPLAGSSNFLACTVSPGQTCKLIAGPYQFALFSPGSTDWACDVEAGVPYLYPYLTAPVILGASNESPIILEFATPHGRLNGDQVFNAECEGNTAANGLWTITYIDTTHYSLDDSVGNGTYVANSGRSGALGKTISRCIWVAVRGSGAAQTGLRSYMTAPDNTAHGGVLACVNDQAFLNTSARSLELNPPMKDWYGGRGVITEAQLALQTSSGGPLELVGALWDAFVTNKQYTLDLEAGPYDGHTWHNFTSPAMTLNLSSALYQGSLFFMIPS
jgi:hypothetical protein